MHVFMRVFMRVYYGSVCNILHLSIFQIVYVTVAPQYRIITARARFLTCSI